MKNLAYNLGGFLHLLTWKDYIILFLIFLIMVLLLVIYYLIKVKDLGEEDVKTYVPLEVDLDLKGISEKLEKEEPKTITLTDYEEEQEDKAIISYQELIERSKTISFEEFDDEYQNFEVKIKKINLDEKSNVPPPKKSKEASKAPMMSDEKEIDFLDALKKLQNKLSK